MCIGDDNKRIGEITLEDLCREGYKFTIPTYQREYRWLTKHVQSLIHDLYSFSNDKYCLQPIVLQKTTGKRFRIIDGQQRLTTLMLLLNKWGKKTWEMEYENVFDKRGLLNEACRENTKKIAQETSDDGKKQILGKCEKIFFIWYLLDEKIDGHETFQRLNSGKIPLTSSELIRSIFLRNDNENRFEMAAEWEHIEQRLRDDRFWFMFNSSSSESYTRIDRLFEIITETEEKVKNDRFSPYYEIEINNKNKNDENKNDENKNDNWWEKLLNLFWMLEQCYNDVEIYHYIGWIRHSTNKQFNSSIYKIYNGNKQAFKKNLMRIILDDLGLLNCDDIEKLEQVISDNYYYGCGNSKLKKFFLCLNIETLNQKTRRLSSKIKQKIDYERFPFDWYRHLSWQIEHIASHTDNPMTDPADQIEWAMETYCENGKKEDTLKEWICQKLEDEKYQDIIKKWCKELKCENSLNMKSNTKLEFSNVYEEFCPKGSVIEDKDKDAVWNLTLLDNHTNQSYHNAIFPRKRRTIIDVSKGFYTEACESSTKIKIYPFIPVCTLNVFTKFYTDKATCITEWNSQDADAYKKYIIDCFWNMKEEEKK